MGVSFTEFLDLYNKLDDLCKEYYRIESRSESAIMRHINNLRRSKYYKDNDRGDDLDAIRNLRNSLVHESLIDGQHLFRVEDVVINKLKKEIQILEDPKLACDVMLLFNNVYKAKINDSVFDIIKTMQEKGYSHVPVINDDNTLLGVFSENVIASKLFNDKSIDLSNNHTLREYLSYLPICNHNNERYIFVSKDTLVEDIIKEFEISKNKYKKKLGMVFVTHNGREKEKLLGVILPMTSPAIRI